MKKKEIYIPGCNNCIINEKNILNCICYHNNEYYLSSLPLQCNSTTGISNNYGN